jgi:argininosuccinate lyase
MKMWSGRFREPLNPEFERWQRSFPFDQRLLLEELAASSAHAKALRKASILTGEELDAILGGLRWIGETFQPPIVDDEAEDVHHFVEKQLHARIGETALKLHTGRSRNEQIATDLRLFTRGSCDTLRGEVLSLVSALVDAADKAGEAVIPSYTHLQRAEPVLLAHWLLAYAEMFLRDASRLADCRARLNLCPLGSGAVAGATLELDRHAIAEELRFDAPCANSIDATSDRDYALEFSQVATLLSVHLSRWAEELILFSTQEYNFVRLPESYSTGSSAMPQKQNPDSLELIRGKSGRVIGASQQLIATVKGLPLAYNKDLQETQEPVFVVADTVRMVLRVATGFMREVAFHTGVMQNAASHGYMNAMAAATYLVRQGVPFRHAHELVAAAVRLGIEKGCELDGLSLDELHEISPAFDEDFYACISLRAVVDCHSGYGGTAITRVRQAVEETRKRLTALQGAVNADL